MITKEKIVEALSKTEAVFYEDLAFLLGVENEDKALLLALVRELEDEGIAIYTKKNKITLTEKLGIISGEFLFFGEIGVIKYKGDEVKIPLEKSGGALPGDTVLVKLSRNHQFGEVYKIIKRGQVELTGVLKKKNGVLVLIVQRARAYRRIVITRKNLLGAKENDKVKALITGYNSEDGGFYAKVTKVYGSSLEVGSNYEAILDANNIKIEFDPQTQADAEKKASEPMGEETLKGRLDLRNVPIFTIDPADAKDLDDAVSLEKTEKGYRLGVHIADVSHYVVAGSPLDKEAILRGTSVYFADKVVPMLPEALSNGVCSLNEKVDRLTMSVFMNIDENGHMLDYEMKESVICSLKKCSYSDINLILSNSADDALKKSYEAVLPYLDNMLSLAAKLRKNRFARGSLDFELNEAKVILDENGVPTDIINRVRGESEKIVEEFMLFANEATARFVFFLSLPYVYRIHEKPDEVKISNLIKVVRLLGFNTKGTNNGIHPAELQKIIAHFMDTKYEKVVSTLALRSLAKAKYSPNCLGHFGLSLEYYCHFTSPIRRYPDLVCHRIIKLILKNELSEQKQNKLKKFCDEASLLSSQAEIRALNAERAIEDMYKAWYMSFRIGKRFMGVISSVTNFGFYVELPNTVEGLVRVSDLNDDYYNFYEDRLCLIGEHLNRQYNIGDEIEVKCTSADISTGQIDFIPVS